MFLHWIFIKSCPIFFQAKSISLMVAVSTWNNGLLDATSAIHKHLEIKSCFYLPFICSRGYFIQFQK